MNNLFYVDIGWVYFCIVFGAMLLVAFVMNIQSKYFYTLHVFVRKFSIIDLESPASALELATYIKGIFGLPPELSKKSISALRGSLYLDFLFMPLVYGSIFLFCMQVSMKLSAGGHWFFALLAWLQIIPWICDIAENIYLLKKIRPDVKTSTPRAHKLYQRIEIYKWIIVFIAIVCCTAMVFYFWLTGNYTYHSIQYLMLIISEIAVVFIMKKISDKTVRVNLDNYKNVSN